MSIESSKRIEKEILTSLPALDYKKRPFYKPPSLIITTGLLILILLFWLFQFNSVIFSGTILVSQEGIRIIDLIFIPNILGNIILIPSAEINIIIDFFVTLFLLAIVFALILKRYKLAVLFLVGLFFYTIVLLPDSVNAPSVPIIEFNVPIDLLTVINLLIIILCLIYKKFRLTILFTAGLIFYTFVGTLGYFPLAIRFNTPDFEIPLLLLQVTEQIQLLRAQILFFVTVVAIFVFVLPDLHVILSKIAENLYKFYTFIKLYTYKESISTRWTRLKSNLYTEGEKPLKLYKFSESKRNFFVRNPYQGLKFLFQNPSLSLRFFIVSVVLLALKILTGFILILNLSSSASKKLFSILKSKTLAVGLAIVFIFLILAVFAPEIAPYSFDARHDDCGEVRRCRQAPPSPQHLMGTNTIGYDLYSRVIYGAQIPFLMSIFAAMLALIAGVPLGLISGYYGGFVDRFLNAVMDLLYSFPAILFAITLSLFLSEVPLIGAEEDVTPKIIVVVGFSVGLVYIPVLFKIVRSQVFQIKELPYIEAIKAIGAPNSTIQTKYILPNVIANPISLIPFPMVDAILTGAALAFLGIGLQAPTPDWGYDLTEGAKVISNSPWWVTYPGLMVFLLAFAFALIGDALNDRYNPLLQSIEAYQKADEIEPVRQEKAPNLDNIDIS